MFNCLIYIKYQSIIGEIIGLHKLLQFNVLFASFILRIIIPCTGVMELSPWLAGRLCWGSGAN